jgi:phosphomannomutase
MTSHDVLAAAHAWIEGDPDPETRAELQRLVSEGRVDELAERMAGTLQFGTAGLRGKVAAGSNRMNRAVVIRATRGVADHLLTENPDDTRPVVIGYDARPSSTSFMEDTVGVLVAAGIPVRFFPEPVPTPLVAYAALAFDARAAIVVTASHNPPADNGYKVYAGNGAQIVPPTDKQISAAIAAVGPAAGVPRVERAAQGADALAVPLGEDVFVRYVRDMEANRVPPRDIPDLKIAYTPLHGVGGRYVVAALAHAGYVDVFPVASQFEPDGRFPTVAFPNPEEPGALDLVTDLAQRAGADLIIANDPDTDRLAVSLPFDDGWRPLTGNQIGVLLGEHLLANTRQSDPIVVSSIVSSPMLGSIADHHGARFVQSLTGFKWIWNAGLDLEQAGEGTFLFGYEEALGYSVGGAVRDKDGISAAVAFADLAAAAMTDGATVWDRLHALYRRHGMWVSNQVSVVRPGTEGAAEISAAMEKVAGDPPTNLAGTPITGVTDYGRNAGHRPRYLPATKLVEFELGDLGRLLVRPSGTEPKLKIYGDLRGDAEHVVDLEDLERGLLARADELAQALVEYLGLR